MEPDTEAPAKQAFQILELIDALRCSSWCQSSVRYCQSIETLLDDLEDTYRDAMETWAEFLTTKDDRLLEDFYHWHEYIFPPDIYLEARWRFSELVTTSRFSVESELGVSDLLNVNQPTEEITSRHVVSLAVLVCIQFALEELEPLEFVDEQSEAEAFTRQIEVARGLQVTANWWLTQLDSLSVSHRELNHEVNKVRVEIKRQLKAEISEKNKRPGYRVAKDLTPKAIASYFKERPNQKVESLISELAEKFGASPETVLRRYSEAKKKNLLS
jgi:hypothetical protein